MMKPKHIFVFFFLFSLINFGCAATTKTQEGLLYYAAPSQIPDTPREMKTPGFWIAQHSAPAQIVMTKEEIEEFNRHIREDLKTTKDILNLPEFSGPELVKEWKRRLDEFQQGDFYGADGQKPALAFFNKINAEMTDTAVDLKITPYFGFIIHYADQRIFPTEEPLYAKPGDIDFDELQNSTLDVGTPVAILAISGNDQWFYVESALSGGWVKRENVALSPLEQVHFFFNQKEFVVVTRAKADIFSDTGLTQYYDYARMGTKFIRHEMQDNNTVAVYLPQRNDDGTMTFTTGYLRSKDVQSGYLPYTPVNVINQAFELLNEPYGWGGMYGEQDCSAFLVEVFSTFGIALPRNSPEQRKSGQLSAEFDKESTDQDKMEALKNAVGGVTLLGMKGHILLYLGMVKERPYAIHAVWAYREPADSKTEDRIRVINRVAVTDLFLGKGSKKGSLLNRLSEVLAVTK